MLENGFNKIEIYCYQESCCGLDKIPAVLGERAYIEPGTNFAPKCFIGWIRWRPEAKVEVFDLYQRVSCPKCKTLFGDAIVITDVEGSFAFGYESEPA